MLPVWSRTSHMLSFLVPLNIKASVWKLPTSFKESFTSLHFWMRLPTTPLMVNYYNQMPIFSGKSGHSVFSHLYHLQWENLCFLYAFWMVQDFVEMHVQSSFQVGDYWGLWRPPNPPRQRWIPDVSLCRWWFQNHGSKILNFIRKFNQAVTLADTTTDDGNRISYQLYKGTESNGLR